MHQLEQEEQYSALWYVIRFIFTVFGNFANISSLLPSLPLSPSLWFIMIYFSCSFLLLALLFCLFLSMSPWSGGSEKKQV
uniref:Uncharacterized protein n=1 Tax=Nelumbo nucifera TaxID=4432 RepID=A0A822XXI7_NELNU|nr:TPA_asm: hypothetical protein HUJ06_027812 [Nelumbo nucifera]